MIFTLQAVFSALIRLTTACGSTTNPNPSCASTGDAASTIAVEARTSAPRDTVRKAAPPTVRVTMKNLVFVPTKLNVPLGTTIVWQNDDPVPHSVTGPDGTFDSGLIQPGASYSHQFNRPGTYKITCKPHPEMTATIVVTAKP